MAEYALYASTGGDSAVLAALGTQLEKTGHKVNLIRLGKIAASKFGLSEDTIVSGNDDDAKLASAKSKYSDADHVIIGVSSDLLDELPYKLALAAKAGGKPVCLVNEYMFFDPSHPFFEHLPELLDKGVKIAVPMPKAQETLLEQYRRAQVSKMDWLPYFRYVLYSIVTLGQGSYFELEAKKALIGVVGHLSTHKAYTEVEASEERRRQLSLQPDQDILLRRKSDEAFNHDYLTNLIPERLRDPESGKAASKVEVYLRLSGNDSVDELRSQWERFKAWHIANPNLSQYLKLVLTQELAREIAVKDGGRNLLSELMGHEHVVNLTNPTPEDVASLSDDQITGVTDDTLRAASLNARVSVRQALDLKCGQQLNYMTGSSTGLERDIAQLEALLRELKRYPDTQLRFDIHPGVFKPSNDVAKYFQDIAALVDKLKDGGQFKLVLTASVVAKLEQDKLTGALQQSEGSYLPWVLDVSDKPEINGSAMSAAADKVSQSVAGAIVNTAAAQWMLKSRWAQPPFMLDGASRPPYLARGFAGSVHAFLGKEGRSASAIPAQDCASLQANPAEQIARFVDIPTPGG